MDASNHRCLPSDPACQRSQAFGWLVSRPEGWEGRFGDFILGNEADDSCVSAIEGSSQPPADASGAAFGRATDRGGVGSPRQDGLAGPCEPPEHGRTEGGEGEANEGRTLHGDTLLTEAICTTSNRARAPGLERCGLPGLLYMTPIRRVDRCRAKTTVLARRLRDKSDCAGGFSTDPRQAQKNLAPSAAPEERRSHRSRCQR